MGSGDTPSEVSSGRDPIGGWRIVPIKRKPTIQASRNLSVLITCIHFVLNFINFVPPGTAGDRQVP